MLLRAGVIDVISGDNKRKTASVANSRRDTRYYVVLMLYSRRTNVSHIYSKQITGVWVVLVKYFIPEIGETKNKAFT